VRIEKVLMMKKPRILIVTIAAALVTMACACPLTGWLQNMANPQGMLEEALPEELEQLMEDLPDDLSESLEQAATVLPDAVEEGMETIPEALSENDLESLFNEGVPENIPMVEGYDDLLAFGGVINYGTTTSMEAMKEFYQEQMPQYGWSVDETAGATDLGPYAAALNYTNETQNATITLVESDGQTLVTIIVTDK